jgi:predicted patatin/cPLA2 family phospholipase
MFASVSLSNFEDGPSLFTALRASARIPVFAGPPVPFRGDKYLDASIYEPIPFKSAVQGGATDIVVLMTRPLDSFSNAPLWIDRVVVAPYLRNIHPDLGRHYLARAKHYREAVETIRNQSARRDGIRILTIQIESHEVTIHPFEKLRSTLLNGALSGFRAV